MDLSPYILKKKYLPSPAGGEYKSIQGIYGFNKMDFFFFFLEPSLFHKIGMEISTGPNLSAF